MQRAPVDAQSLMAKMLEQAPSFTLRRRPFFKFFMLNDAWKVLPKPQTVAFAHTETLAPLSASFLSPRLPYFQGVRVCCPKARHLGYGRLVMPARKSCM